MSRANTQRTRKIIRTNSWGARCWFFEAINFETAALALVVRTASYDETLRYGAQTPFSDQLIGHLEGGEWKVDGTHTSLIAAGNGGGKPVQTALTIFYDQGRKQYRLEKTIAADDQWWVDIGSLIRGQTPDANGNTLPTDLTSGAYQLREFGGEIQNTLYEGKVITDKTYGHATYGCMVCCGYGEDAGLPYLVEDPTGVTVSASTSVDVFGTNACTGSSDNLDNYFPTWSSTNTSILTAANQTITGVSVGSTSIHANATRMPTGQGEDQRTACPLGLAQSTGQGTVAACPSSVSVNSNTPISITSNPSLHTGYGNMVSMLVSPASPQSSTYRIVESVTPQTNSCPFTVFPTITQTTSSVFNVGAAAVLDDNPNVVYPVIPNAFYDELSVRDTTSDLPASMTSCQATATHSYYCSGVLLGTFTDTTKITHGTQSDSQPASIVATTQQ